MLYFKSYPTTIAKLNFHFLSRICIKTLFSSALQNIFSHLEKMKNPEDERKFIKEEDYLPATYPEEHSLIQTATARSKNQICVNWNACLILTLIFAVFLIQEIGVQASCGSYFSYTSPWDFGQKRKSSIQSVAGTSCSRHLALLLPTLHLHQ